MLSPNRNKAKVIILCWPMGLKTIIYICLREQERISSAFNMARANFRRARRKRARYGGIVWSWRDEYENREIWRP